MSERFFVESPIQGDHARLAGGEAQHLTKVLRAKAGDEIVVFDGGGAEYSAVIETIARQEVTLCIVERREISRELTRELTLAVALPKGDRQQWLVEKLTELGVTRLVPLITQRGVAQPVESALARLRRWVVEAAKQCGRNKLLEIASPATWHDYAISAPANTVRYFAHPATGGHIDGVARDPFIAAVGPEGGWADAEVSHARAHGWQPIDLGPRVLRVETAAVMLAVLGQQD